MIPQVQTPVKTQFLAVEPVEIESLICVTIVSSGEETTVYNVSVDIGCYEDNFRVLKTDDTYFCECGEFEHNAAQRKSWSCLHTEAVKAAEHAGEIEQEPIPF